MDYPPIVIIGESGSGKSTLANELARLQPDFEKVVTYTTRPKRDGEQEGVDYHFVEEKEFNDLVNKKFFIEHASYRGWNYGIALRDCGYNKILVLTPAGMRTIKKSLKVASFYLKVDRRSRLVKLLKRGDDIEEAYRRSLSDVGQFDGVENEVDYTINNENYRLDAKNIAEKVLGIMDGNSNTNAK